MSTSGNTPEERSESAAALESAWASPPGFGLLSEVNQKPMGRRYMITGFIFFLIGGFLALLMRLQLAVPQNDFIDHQLYNELFTMHGTTMLFLFAVPILEGFALYIIPPMVGARDMAFPRLGAFGYWCYLFGGILLYSSFLFAMVPDAGWTMYPPLSDANFSPGPKIDFWLMGITLVEIGGITAAAEIAVTILKCRAPGMSLNRMPLFAWYMLVVSFMILFGFPPLIMGDLLLELERSLDWPFFDAARGGDPLLWQHLFWIFGHPEVYIIFLPAAGFVSMIIATFSQRPTVGYSWLVIAAVGTGFVSFGLWAHHMFTTGIPLISLSFFSVASMTVSIFAGIQVFAWIATLWTGKPIMKTPLLFVIGFLLLFVIGGLSGVMLAVIPFDWQAHSTYFLISHFHYVLIGGMVFPLFAAFYYWFPTATGRMMSETLGKWNFWLMFIGFNVAFLPMKISGMMGMPRRVYTYPVGMWEWENLVSTIGAFIMALSVLVFLFNFFRSARHGEPAGDNPWNAGTLEWSTRLPMPAYNFHGMPEVRTRYPLWEEKGIPERIHAGDFLLPRPHENKRLAVSTGSVRAELEHVVIMPKPDFSPITAALGLTILFSSVLLKSYLVAFTGGLVFLLAMLRWFWQQPLADVAATETITRETGLPTGAARPRGFGWWGTILAIAGDATLFVSLLFAYFYLWAVASGWPPLGMQLAGWLPVLGSLALLLVGSLAIEFGSRSGRQKPIVIGLLAICVLGLVYTALQGWMLLQSGLSPQAHSYSAVVFTLSGFHLLHVLTAVAMAAFSLVWTLAGRSVLPGTLMIQNTALFWHYVVGMGLVFNGVVFLWPLLG